MKKKRRREHKGILADDALGRSTIMLRIIGERPKYRPYLSIEQLDAGRLIGTVTNANALRGLAHAILRSLGDE